MKKVISKDRYTGSVAITSFALEDKENFEEVVDKYMKGETDHYKIVEPYDLPLNRFFFDDWVYNELVPENPIDINVENAHGRWKNVWRELRKPMLETLDVQFMIALENGDMELSRSIGQKKKTLRDVTLIELPGKEPGETVDDFSDKIMRIRPEILDWSSSKIPLSNQ